MSNRTAILISHKNSDIINNFTGFFFFPGEEPPFNLGLVFLFSDFSIFFLDFFLPDTVTLLLLVLTLPILFFLELFEILFEILLWDTDFFFSLDSFTLCFLIAS